MFGIKLKLTGDYACFTRPEMKVERVSYEVPTPSAIRGVIECIYWHPGIKFFVDKIVVYNPIKFINVRRNEVKNKLSFQNVKRKMSDKTMDKTRDISIVCGENKISQRASYILKDVCYGVEAHFKMTGLEGDDVNKHYAIITRRIKKGQCVKQPVLGCREFSCSFEWIDELPPSDAEELSGERDLGYMLYDMDFADPNNIRPIFYRPCMKNGVIDVQKYYRETMRR